MKRNNDMEYAGWRTKIRGPAWAVLIAMTINGLGRLAVALSVYLFGFPL